MVRDYADAGIHKMRCVVPFAYGVTTVVPGRATPATKVLVDRTSVDIPEYSADEVPAAARWQRTIYPRHDSPVVEATVLNRGGAFYTLSDLTVEMLADLETRRGDISTIRAFQDERARRAFQDERAGPIWRYLVATWRRHVERDEALSSVEAFLSDLVVVDGTIWCKTREPVIVMHNVSGEISRETIDPGDPEHRTGAMGVTFEGAAFDDQFPVLASMRRIGGPGLSRIFRMDEADEALEIVRAGPRDRSGRHYVTFERRLRSMDLLLPEAFVFDVPLNDVNRALSECVDATRARGRGPVSELPNSLRVRELQDQFGRSGEPDLLADAVGLAEAMFTETGRQPTERQTAALERLYAAAEHLPISIEARGIRP